MSKLKVVSIQHPDAVNPSIELAADGSISIDKVPAGDVNVTPVGSIVSEDVQAVLEELDTNKAALSGATFTGDVVLAGDPDADLKAATKQYVDNNSFDPTALLALKAEQNVYLWEMQASTLGSTKKFTGWQGEGFLVGQDEVASLTGLNVTRDADLSVGALGILARELDNWTLRTSGVTVSLYDVLYDGSQFVVSGAGEILTSPDGVSWTVQALATNSHMLGIAYDGTVLVTCGSAGQIFTSPDGITWTERSTPNTEQLNAIAYGAGLFVVVGNGNTVITSPDGITWTARSTPNTDAMRGVGYGGGLFVAGRDSGDVITSPDGITWTGRSTPITSVPRAIGHADGLFVAGSAFGRVITSPDAITWTERDTPTSASLYGVTYTNGLFLFVGRDDGTAITSPDGITWTERTTPTTENLDGVTSGDGLLVAVGANGTIITAGAGTDDSGTLALTTVTLPATADSVYLLDDTTIDVGVTLIYEATLDGTTWETVTPGDTVLLAHSGTAFAIRVSMERAAYAEDEGRVFWMIGYAS